MRQNQSRYLSLLFGWQNAFSGISSAPREVGNGLNGVVGMLQVVNPLSELRVPAFEGALFSKMRVPFLALSPRQELNLIKQTGPV